MKAARSWMATVQGSTAETYLKNIRVGSPHPKAINEALLKLRESGVLDELNAKWFGTED